MGAQRCELAAWESLDQLRGGGIGRLCIIEHGFPLAIPVNYRIVGSNDDIRVVVCTAPETMLGRYEGPGSLEADDVNFDDGTAWSVIVRGSIRRAAGSHDLPDPKPLVTDGRHQWMTLQMTAISGRRFTIARAADGLSVDWHAIEPLSDEPKETP